MRPINADDLIDLTMDTVTTSQIQFRNDITFDLDGNSVLYVKQDGQSFKFDEWVKKKSAEETKRILRGREWRRRR